MKRTHILDVRQTALRCVVTRPNTTRKLGVECAQHLASFRRSSVDHYVWTGASCLLVTKKRGSGPDPMRREGYRLAGLLQEACLFGLLHMCPRGTRHGMAQAQEFTAEVFQASAYPSQSIKPGTTSSSLPAPRRLSLWKLLTLKTMSYTIL